MVRNIGYIVILITGSVLLGYGLYELFNLIIFSPGISLFFRVIIPLGIVGLLLTIAGLAIERRAEIRSQKEIEESNWVPTKSKINLNKANKEKLMELSGIGSKIADEIIKYRKQNPFKQVEEIKQITGISTNTFRELKNRITV